MRPNKAGVWEWFDANGVKQNVYVCDVGTANSWFRVYWWGGYYNVNDDEGGKSQWPDRWGKFVATSLPDDQLYLMPTPEEKTEILKLSLKEEIYED